MIIHGGKRLIVLTKRLVVTFQTNNRGALDIGNLLPRSLRAAAKYSGFLSKLHAIRGTVFDLCHCNPKWNSPFKKPPALFCCIDALTASAWLVYRKLWTHAVLRLWEFCFARIPHVYFHPSAQLTFGRIKASRKSIQRRLHTVATVVLKWIWHPMEGLAGWQTVCTQQPQPRKKEVSLS